MSLNSLTDQKLGTIGTISSALGVFFILPSPFNIIGVVVFALVVGLTIFLKSRWVEAGADEWLLVIKDGKLSKAGIGLKTISGLNDTIVKFPSRVEKVTFSANNVTQ